VPERWRPLLALNPMTGVIEAFRWALLGTGDAPLGALAGSALTVFLLLCSGLLYFRRMERTFADVI
jgi:lipopolysaccharide transport system permease protein